MRKLIVMLTPLASICWIRPHFFVSKWIFLFAVLMAPGYANSDQPGFTTDDLIGTTIFALSETKTGNLRGWHSRGGATLGYSELGLGLSEYYRDGQAIFIITRIDGKLNKTILDFRSGVSI